MNDVVIKVSENAEDATRLDITLCCTGAANNLTVYLDDMVFIRCLVRQQVSSSIR